MEAGASPRGQSAQQVTFPSPARHLPQKPRRRPLTPPLFFALAEAIQEALRAHAGAATGGGVPRARVGGTGWRYKAGAVNASGEGPAGPAKASRGRSHISYRLAKGRLALRPVVTSAHVSVGGRKHNKFCIRQALPFVHFSYIRRVWIVARVKASVDENGAHDRSGDERLLRQLLRGGQLISSFRLFA